MLFMGLTPVLPARRHVGILGEKTALNATAWLQQTMAVLTSPTRETHSNTIRHGRLASRSATLDDRRLNQSHNPSPQFGWRKSACIIKIRQTDLWCSKRSEIQRHVSIPLPSLLLCLALTCWKANHEKSLHCIALMRWIKPSYFHWTKLPPITHI